MYNYNLDDNQVVLENLPPEEQGSITITWLKLLLKPLKLIYNTFIVFKDETLYLASITSQIIFLEKLLNDKYDAIQRRIFIETLDNKPPTYVFYKIENKPSLFVFKKSENKPPLYLYNASQTGGNYDFIVHIPLSLTFNLNQLKAYLNAYKLASKRYNIVYF